MSSVHCCVSSFFHVANALPIPFNWRPDREIWDEKGGLIKKGQFGLSCVW